MTVKLSSLKADLKRENDGDWVPYSELGSDVAFKVRALSYGPYQTKRDREQKRLTIRYPDGQYPQEESDRIDGQLLAEDILLDWRGFDVPYSPDTALDTLSDPAYREVRFGVKTCAIRIANIKIEFVENAVKNSAPPSAKS
jgi:hypothetical protein